MEKTWQKSFDIDPCPAPRQSQRDKFKPSPQVRRYRAFRDFLFYKARPGLPKAKQIKHIKLQFEIAMPAVWDRQKKFDYLGLPHQQKPDLDNLIKAAIDALWPKKAPILAIPGSPKYDHKLRGLRLKHTHDDDDAGIGSLSAEKVWSDKGKVTITLTWEDKNE